MFGFSKKELPVEKPDEEKKRLYDEIRAQVEADYRANFNFSCLFQDQEQDGIIVRYAGIFAVILIIVNIIITFTR